MRPSEIYIRLFIFYLFFIYFYSFIVNCIRQKDINLDIVGNPAADPP
jgi:hypothetical protein